MYHQPLPPPYGSPGSVPPAPPVMAPQQQGYGTVDASILGVLRNMEREDLQRLDERAIDSLLSDDKDLRELEDQKVTETASNRSLAEHSLTYQTRLDRGKRSLTSAHQEAAELARAHRDLRDRLQRGGRAAGGGGGESLESLHSLLQSACLEAEELADSLLEELQANRLTLAEFVGRHTEARALYHTRRAKADKVTEISNQRIVQPFRTTESGAAGLGGAPVMYQQQQQQQQPTYGGMPSYYFPVPPYQPYGGGGGRP